MPSAAATRSVPRSLLGGAVDYAGMFPPAGLSLEATLENYLRYRASPDAWALGRLVVPVAALTRLATLLPAAPAADPVPLAAVLAGPDAESLDQVARFNHGLSRQACIEVVELKAGSGDAIARALALIPAGLLAYLEVPVGEEATPLLEQLAAAGARAKLRTGGTASDAFPAPEVLLGTLADAVRLGVPLKATAGLHHALRGSYPLSYEPSAPNAPMFGFLNLMLAVLCLVRGAREAAGDALREADPAALQVDEDVLQWRGMRFPVTELAALRRSSFHGFGSCSFREPLDELSRFGWA